MSNSDKYNDFIRKIAAKCLEKNNGKKIPKEVYREGNNPTYFMVADTISEYMSRYYEVGDIYYFAKHIKNRKVRYSCMVDGPIDIYDIIYAAVRTGVVNDVTELILE